MACPRHEAAQPPPLVQNGHVRFQALHVGWIVCGMFTLVASVASAWLIRKHLRWYSCKPQQRHIVRLLFMVPIYAIITLASYILYTHATSLLLVRDAYESVVLASFFALLLEYLPGPVLPGAPNTTRVRKRTSSSEAEKLAPSQTSERLSRKERAAAVHRMFYNIPMHPDPTRGKPLKWIWPLGRVKARPKDGLSYLHWMKWGVLQYCVVRPGSTLAAVILDNMNLYCEASWSWRWGHVWVVTIVSISVTVAMYCLIQLYTTISKELKPYHPLLKLFAVKAVVFLTFWQGALLSGLASLDIIKDGEYLTAEQIVIGFAALLQTFEMMCFAFLHVKAFSYVPYKRLAQSSTQNTDLPATGRRQFMNLVQAFTFTDTWRDLVAGVLYFFGRGTSRQADEACRRDEGYREVFGRERVRVRVDTITERERSFTKIRGYKGLPEDDKAIRLGDLQYSPLPCPDDQPLLGRVNLDDPPPPSILRSGRKSRRWPASPPLSPPPRGAYVPVHGPRPSLGWEEVYSPAEARPRRVEARELAYGETRNSPRRETHIPASEAVSRSGLLSPVSPSRSGRDLHCPIPPNPGHSPGSQRPAESPHQALPSPRSLPSPHHPLPSPRLERRPSVSDDSLLQRVFSSATRTTESRGLDSASTRSGGTRIGEFGERSSYFGSSELLSSVEDASRARVVPIRTGVPTLVPLGGSTGSSTTSASWHTPHTPVSNQLPSPPEPARRPRRSGPDTQPRSVVLPTPLSPARYPHATWRTMTNQSSRPPAVRTQGLTHVSSVHVRPSHWSPVQPGSAGSSESGLAGRAAGRSSVGATYEPMSSLSTLSNIDDRYPDVSRNSREGR